MSRPAALALALMVISGCSILSGSDESGSGIDLGEGSPPGAFPADFPMPPNAAVGSTLVDPEAHRSEMTMQVGSPLSVTVQFFTVGLVNGGFVVENSDGDAQKWTIVFSREALRGTIVVSALGDSSQVLATVNSI